MIRRKGSKFYLEVFNPQHDWKLLGIIITINIPDEQSAFVTHIKKPEIHYFIKGQGYPINEELLKMLKNARIEYIIIPESGKTGFKAYIAETENYLKGELVSEPMTEKQRSVPLKELSTIDIDEERLKNYMYG
ncbi:MAG: hypothetical protein IMZ52_04435 [Actinobacteria bacterium]|nr:hypothetical protein [Actinomycetota bacterium]MBE3122033.1 hypothetical protein [Thermoplasmata archaeon]